MQSDVSILLLKYYQIIKKIEEKRNNLIGTTSKSKVLKTPAPYTIPNNDLESDSIFNSSESTSLTFKQDQSDYYKERSEEAQLIEKSMGDLSGMFQRLTSAIYDQRFYIDR